MFHSMETLSAAWQQLKLALAELLEPHLHWLENSIVRQANRVLRLLLWLAR